MKILSLWIGINLSILGSGCRPQGKTGKVDTLTDAPLAGYQVKLLDLAFSTASALPLEPHIKNRARAQESVVDACLKLDQDRRAYNFIQQIPNWRAGMAYADLAFKRVRQGATATAVEPYLTQALDVAQKNEDWRKDRIKARVAQVQALLGQDQAAQAQVQDINEISETGKLALVQAMNCAPNDFDAQMTALQATMAGGNYDLQLHALQAYAELLDRFYSDSSRRKTLVESIEAGWGKLPYTVRIDLLGRMMDSALAHDDQAQARTWVDQAHAMTQNADWPMRFLIPIRARLAQWRFRVGEPNQAREEIQDAWQQFESKQKTILDIDRAGLLRSLAEASQVTGAEDQALKFYKKATEAGVENPNSRPRAEDLSATCCSMAVHQVEPDEALWQRLQEIHAGLGDPW